MPIFPTQLVTTVNQSVRLGLPALNSRVLPRFNVTTSAAAIVGAETLAVAATTTRLWAGERLRFGANSAIVASTVNLGVTSIPVEPLEAAIASAAVASTMATIPIAGATDATPSSEPKTTDATTYSSGIGTELAVIALSRTLSFTFNRIVGDPGGDALMQILFNNRWYNREVYVIVERENGEIYEGACVCTTGSQQAPVQEKVTMNVNLQFQGTSFKYTPGTGAVTPVFG